MAIYISEGMILQIVNLLPNRKKSVAISLWQMEMKWDS